MLVLAGGFGTRLQSMLPSTPKALAPVAGTPFLELQLNSWIAQGLNSFVFLLHHQADQIINFLDGVDQGLLKNCEVVSVIEPTPLGTGGAVAYAVRELGLQNDFLVTNADTWLGSGVGDMTTSCAPAIAVVQIEDSSRFGQVQFDDNFRVTAFKEKSDLGSPGWINAGLCRLSAEQFRNWKGGEFSLENVIFQELALQGKLRAVPIKTDFIDIGIPRDYQRFCQWIDLSR